jgi:hypothetical protein
MAAESNARKRHDGFSAERRRYFLVALRNGESVLAACALVGVSNRTAYNHRGRDPEFARDWDRARQVWKLPIELAAYERAVIGIEEPVYSHGRQVRTRTRYSDSLLRTLLAGEKPHKYGRRVGLKADRKWLGKRIDTRVADATAPLRQALEKALAEIESLRTLRNSAAGPVNFVNPLRAGRRASPRRNVCGNWRLAAARRRCGTAGMSDFSSSS